MKKIILAAMVMMTIAGATVAAAGPFHWMPHISRGVSSNGPHMYKINSPELSFEARTDKQECLRAFSEITTSFGDDGWKQTWMHSDAWRIGIEFEKDNSTASVWCYAVY